LDSPLTDLGHDQARKAARELSQTEFHRVYSSDAGRAIDTARIIADGRGLDVVPTKALRERFYGAYEGLNSDEIEARFPGTRYLQGRDTRADWRPVDGETLVEVRARVLEFFKDLVIRHASETVLLVTHSGVVRVIDSEATGESLDDIWDRAPGNACIFHLEAASAGHLHVTAHFCNTYEPKGAR